MRRDHRRITGIVNIAGLSFVCAFLIAAVPPASAIPVEASSSPLLQLDLVKVPPPKTSANWSVADIYRSSSTDWISSVAVDSRGRPHIAFAGQSEQAIYHAFWTSSSWEVEKVCDTIFYATPIIALDSNDAPHIIYSDYYGERLSYAYNTSGQWVTEVICYAMGTGLCGIGPSFVLDSQDRPHVSYYDALYDVIDSYHVMYVTRQQPDGAWQFNMLHSYGVISSDDFLEFRGTSLALDSRGHPRLAFAAERKSEVVYASYDGNSWSGTAIGCLDLPSWGSACGLPSLALDAQDRPHISFFKDFADPPSRSGWIAYASLNGTGWDLRLVSSSGLAYTSIVTDSDSKVHIFHAPNWYMLRTEVGANMTTEVVDPQYGAQAIYPDGAVIDRSGGYHVVYCHRDQATHQYSVRYAHKWGRLNITISRIFGDGGDWQKSSQASGPGYTSDCVPILHLARFEPAAVLIDKAKLDGFQSD